MWTPDTMKAPKVIEAIVGGVIESGPFYTLRYGGMPSKETFTVIVENQALIGSTAYALTFPSDNRFLPIDQLQSVYEIHDLTRTKITLEERASEVWPPDDSILDSRR